MGRGALGAASLLLLVIQLRALRAQTISPTLPFRGTPGGWRWLLI